MRLSERAMLMQHLAEICEKAIAEVTLAPSIEIRDISVEAIRSRRFASQTRDFCYIVTITTNDATLVRGAVQRFKGSYKERLEGVLDRIAKEDDPHSSVHVEIIGTETPTVDRLIPVSTFLRRRTITSTSPIVRAARKNGIHYIQIRGRHLIAPSPAVAKFLESFCMRDRAALKNAADFFAGTGVATKVLLRVANPDKIVLIEKDPLKIAGIRKHIKDERVMILQADVTQFSFIDEYDIAIADPYYEDVHTFLDAQLANLKRFVRALILVPGNVEDRSWNDTVYRRLQDAKYNIEEHEYYGQIIFECTQLQRHA
jgi:predicted RNA methylase